VTTEHVNPPAHRAPLTEVGDALGREADAYKAGEARPLGGYLALLGAYGAAVGVGIVLVRRRNRAALPTVTVRDVALTALATFQLSRMITKKPITSAIRAPFTRYEGSSGAAELHEHVRGDGLRHAVGELLTCPFCMEHWIATAFGFGFALAPEPTRLVGAMLAAEAGADFLQFARAAADRASR
jgi:hypothetical protein